MQGEATLKSMTIPQSSAAAIARLLRRCAELETERAEGRTMVPKVVMTGIAAEASYWARFLDTSWPEQLGDGPLP